MRICIYGAGAIGAFLGAELTRSGIDTTLIARGAHLEAMRERGLRLRREGEEDVVPVRCSGDPAELEPQDYLILGVKAHSIPEILGSMAPLLDDETAVVSAQNGIPWWYFYRFGGRWEDRRLESVDPGGRIWEMLGPERAIGCVVYPSCEVVEPGVVEHLSGNRMMLGEPDGSKSERVTALAEAFRQAGLKAPVRSRIRDDIWLKLWGNVAFNPVSVLTQATLEQMGAHEGVRGVLRSLMLEAQAVAERLGVRLPVDLDTRIQWGADVGEHKTSMLQDLERGRPMEIEAIVGVVSELARLVEVSTPVLDAVLALVRLRAERAASAPAAERGSAADAGRETG